MLSGISLTFSPPVLHVVGDISQVVLPTSLEVINFGGCDGVTGDIADFDLPEGIKQLELSYCTKIHG